MTDDNSVTDQTWSRLCYSNSPLTSLWYWYEMVSHFRSELVIYDLCHISSVLFISKLLASSSFDEVIIEGRVGHFFLWLVKLKQSLFLINNADNSVCSNVKTTFEYLFVSWGKHLIVVSPMFKDKSNKSTRSTDTRPPAATCKNKVTGGSDDCAQGACVTGIPAGIPVSLLSDNRTVHHNYNSYKQSIHVDISLFLNTSMP